MPIKASMASPCPSSSSSWNYSCMLMLNCLPVSHLGGCEQSWVTMWTIVMTMWQCESSLSFTFSSCVSSTVTWIYWRLFNPVVGDGFLVGGEGMGMKGTWLPEWLFGRELHASLSESCNPVTQESGRPIGRNSVELHCCANGSLVLTT